MSGIRCFLIEPTDEVRLSLRRYVSSAQESCSRGPYHYHQAEVLLEVRGRVEPVPGGGWRSNHADVPHADPRWPTRCACGRRFVEADVWQVFDDRLYRRVDTDELLTLRTLPPGAMFYTDWLEEYWPGPDGRSLSVQTPGGLWHIDGPASNCTMKEDRVHRCWSRHGIPPRITVDKAGNSCSAGAGSIQAGSYHGFLRDGELVAA